MTKDEILKIKEHIEIHARREPEAIKITEIMWKAVDELEQIAELERENAELKEALKNDKVCKCSHYLNFKDLEAELTKAKAIMNIAIEGIKYWGIVGGKERPFEKQAAMLFNLFLDKAEQFIKGDSEPQSKWINPARTTNDNEIKIK